MIAGNGDGLAVGDMDIFEQSNYDLNVVFIPGEKMLVKFHYNSLVFGVDLIKKLGLHVKEILKQVTETPGIKIKDINISYDLAVPKSRGLREDRGDFVF